MSKIEVSTSYGDVVGTGKIGIVVVSSLLACLMSACAPAEKPVSQERRTELIAQSRKRNNWIRQEPWISVSHQ